MRCPGNKKHQGSGTTTGGKVSWLSGRSSFRCVRPFVVLPCVWALVLWPSVLPGAGCWCLLPPLRLWLLLLSSWSPALVLVFRKERATSQEPIPSVFLPGRASFRHTQVHWQYCWHRYMLRWYMSCFISRSSLHFLSFFLSPVSTLFEHASLRVLVSQCRVGGTSEDDASFDVPLVTCGGDELQATGCSFRTSFGHGVIVLASGRLPRLGRSMWSSGSSSTGTVLHLTRELSEDLPKYRKESAACLPLAETAR